MLDKQLRPEYSFSHEPDRPQTNLAGLDARAMRRRKFTFTLVVLVLLECCLLLAAFSDSHLDKPGTGSVWFAWQQNPTPQTEAAWNAERGKLHREQAVIGLVIWLLIISTGAGIICAAKRRKAQV